MVNSCASLMDYYNELDENSTIDQSNHEFTHDILNGPLSELQTNHGKASLKTFDSQGLQSDS
ncbi:hypothetical protein TorRG33x02_148790 [Trema orientale]|uniref:Uncharacterized protein n=1 Tax=Trema orientale TaxID=63057 RepID=A0A2P5EUX6_TREOI|nr:hypothetical protein TorRG33x02_148790 [Trema orientale]